MTAYVRDETPADAGAIAAVVTAAFDGHPYSDGTEAALVTRLRAAGALSASLVAVDESGEVIGHVSSSPVVLDADTGGWEGLAPLSVHPDHQRRGVGSALVQALFGRLRAQGAAGVVVLGDPAYYHRFGFAARDGLRCEFDVPAGHFMAMALTASVVPAAIVHFHPVIAAS
ncbi:GNAT family N-acetyltransferase [Microvirgula aerodenitrificans]|uniref:GNAT family N-acetyltransferase n=1 Tax=Microvirgula aerodenitrificans TaxID=57480 RepID=UPI00048F1A3D|nr:N-acetyltransferase [Microvirgula aerodenitrificans]